MQQNEQTGGIMTVVILLIVVDLHRMGQPPKKGVKRRVILGVRRKPERILGIDKEVLNTIMEDGDLDALVTKMGDQARKMGFHYLWFKHPSFMEPEDMDVFISLFPWDDLEIVKVIGEKK